MRNPYNGVTGKYPDADIEYLLRGLELGVINNFQFGRERRLEAVENTIARLEQIREILLGD